MRTVFILLFLLGKQVAQGAVQSDNSEGENCNDQSINVVSFVNPDPGSVKESLEITTARVPKVVVGDF